MDDLTLLGSGKTKYPTTPEEAKLETFENKVKKDYCIRFNVPEFTSLCPITGQPDFAELIIDYVPDKRCVESKSLKLYIFSYRNHGAFHETVVNKVLDDLSKVCEPKWMRVAGFFNKRGGIGIDVFAETGKLPEGVYVDALYAER